MASIGKSAKKRMTVVASNYAGAIKERIKTKAAKKASKK